MTEILTQLKYNIMSCNSNKNLGGLRNILDMSVTYTGCAAECGGVEIKNGDSLRNVLDALVANCDGGSGPGEASTNFWFSVEAPTFTVDVKPGDFSLTGSGAIYQFTGGDWVDTGIQIGGGSGGDGSWGSITGEIADQTDLTEYINLLITEAPINPDNIGTNIHLDADGKLNGGYFWQLAEDEGLEYAVLNAGEFSYPRNTPGSSLVLSDGALTFAELSSSGTVTVTAENAMTLRANNEPLIVRDTDSAIVLGGTFPPGLSKGLYIDGSRLLIGNGSGNSMVFNGPDFNITNVMSVSGTGADKKTVFGASSGTLNGGFVVRNHVATDLHEITVGTYNFVDDTYGDIDFKYGVTPTLDNDLDIPHKGYVDNQVSALEAIVTAQAATIADLTTRLEALENA